MLSSQIFVFSLDLLWCFAFKRSLMYDTLLILMFGENKVFLSHYKNRRLLCNFVECTAHCCDEMLFGVLASFNCTAIR